MDTFFLYLSHLRTPLAMGWLVLLFLWESAVPFYGFFREQTKARLFHALRNLLLGAAGAIIPALGYVALLARTTAWAEEHRFGVLNVVAPPAWAHAIGAVLLLDVATYWWHRANHRLPFLWRFHRVHHADAEMDVTTASRFHLGEIVMSSALRIPFVLLAGIHLWELALFETLMLAVVQFHHANIWVGARLDRLLRLFIATPAMHKVHHSRLRPETDSNYSAMLSVWDRLFRSFRLRDDPRAIRIGLDEFDTPADKTVAGMFKMPFVDAESSRGAHRDSAAHDS
jgi:sterol desaturase/sphingolipid hydroxylase (fatty acid hydroxylase superfamily)